MEQIEERDSPGSRRRSLLFVTQRSDQSRVALLLRAKAITRVRRSKAAIDAWLAHNFPFVTENLVKKAVVP